MPDLIVNTNRYLNSEATFLQKIAQSVCASSNLEGITISVDEALKIAKEVYSDLKKQRK